MKTQLIMLLDTPIIVSDEEIKEGDWYVRLQHIIGKDTDLEFNIDIDIFQRKTSSRNKELFISEGWINGIKNGLQHNCNLIHCKKIIAGIEGLPSIDWNGLEEEFGWVDYTLKEFEEERNKVYEETGSLTACTIVDRGISLGFKKALSLNEKKFSLEDMFKCFQAGIDYEKEGSILQPDAHGYIQSLQQPKVFDIEVGTFLEGGFHTIPTIKPKITNNSIKILKKL